MLARENKVKVVAIIFIKDMQNPSSPTERREGGEALCLQLE